MAKTHVGREPTFEPTDVEVAQPVGPGVTSDPPAELDVPPLDPPRRRARRSPRPVTRAQAGHAAAEGKASGA